MNGKHFTLEIQPRIPKRLERLEELANDLLYTWDRQVRRLFFRLDRPLWENCGHNPKVFLRRVAQQTLEAAEQDRGYMEEFNRAISGFDTYHDRGMHPELEATFDKDRDLVAYFCAEFGFHESFPIYSGGLGILAGDHCKAASDLGIPFVAMGLLYRQGYFSQTIDAQGNQLAHYHPKHFRDLPVAPAWDDHGQEVYVTVALPTRNIELKVWLARAGHVRLYLLDCDIPANQDEDRAITYQLYGGDTHTRILQEMVLGIGGVHAMRALGLQPTIWHINEGHAAFQILERCREQVANGMAFPAALELTAAGTVFTTHTPVPAGHDIFDEDLISGYFAHYIEQLGIDLDTFLALGASPGNEGSFNMTALALRGSRFHNGVSRIHGGVASHMESYVWPQITPEENPITHVTNGVHLPTFLAREWVNLFDMRFREWRSELLNEDYWQCLDDIPDHRFWSLRRELKTVMLTDVQRRAYQQHRRNGCSEAHIEALTRGIAEPTADVLVLGFARRFATYKRATLLFNDPDRLARLLNDPERPVLLVFAGKAHPNDAPGQELIRAIHEYARQPKFLGKIIVLEGYNMALARKLVTGVDIWLNTPEYPLEASGTSGEKAGINGVLNLSVADGWWDEGYNQKNGWAITPHSPEVDADYRNNEEADELLNLLETEVVPLYFARDHQGYSAGWVQRAKESMKSLIPRFNAQHMVMEYIQRLYAPAKRKHHNLAQDNGALAHELATWKRKVAERWSKVDIELADGDIPAHIKHDESMRLRVITHLNGLTPEDVIVECLVGYENDNGNIDVEKYFELEPTDEFLEQHTVFALDFRPDLSGMVSYRIRMYPYHPALSRRFEVGLMCWL